MFIAVLAYHGGHLLCMLLQHSSIHASWAGSRNRLAGWPRVTTTMGTNAKEPIGSR